MHVWGRKTFTLPSDTEVPDLSAFSPSSSDPPRSLFKTSITVLCQCKPAEAPVSALLRRLPVRRERLPWQGTLPAGRAWLRAPGAQRRVPTGQQVEPSVSSCGARPRSDGRDLTYGLAFYKSTLHFYVAVEAPGLQPQIPFLKWKKFLEKKQQLACWGSNARDQAAAPADHIKSATDTAKPVCSGRWKKKNQQQTGKAPGARRGAGGASAPPRPPRQDRLPCCGPRTSPA